MGAIKTSHRGRRDAVGPKGRILWRVFEHTEEGLEKLRELKQLLLSGKITKEERDVRRQAILDDPNYSRVKQQGRSLSDKRFFSKSIFNQVRWMLGWNTNIVTDEGDALIADHMTETDARTLVDNTNGYIAVGTGWTGTTPKQNTAVNTATGSPEVMDATYPKLKGAWAAADDNVAQYRSTFEAGDLDASDINEAGLGNNAVEASGDCMAYGQITPAVTVGTSDTLQVDWEITYTGA